jgi:hypothetical protein
MAAYASQIVPYLLKGQHSPAVVSGLGSDIMGSSKEVYNVNLELLMLIAMVMQGVQALLPGATDAFWLDRINHALDTGPGGDISGWLGWIILQVAPENLAQYGATEADTVASLRTKIETYNAGQQSLQAKKAVR